MLHLRTTTALSALALVLGVAGTGWLSTLTASGFVPESAYAFAATAAKTTTPPAGLRRSPHRQRVAAPAQAAVQMHTTYRARTASLVDASPPPAANADNELVPLTTPTDASLSWEQLRGHLDGRVLLQVSVDGSGRVTAASVAQSSGDELLDAHALRSVRGWRFAVPDGHAAGLRGEVPVTYSSGNGAP